MKTVRKPEKCGSGSNVGTWVVSGDIYKSLAKQKGCEGLFFILFISCIFPVSLVYNSILFV